MVVKFSQQNLLSLSRPVMPFSESVTLTTRRVILRPLRHEDVGALFAIWSDADAMRYFSFPVMTCQDQATDRVARKLKTSADGKDFICAVELRTTGVPSRCFSLGVCHQLRGQAARSVAFIDPQEWNLKVFPVCLRGQFTNDVLVIVPAEHAQRTNVILDECFVNCSGLSDDKPSSPVSGLSVNWNPKSTEFALSTI
jgi:GNAT acetyltransferase-like protein